MNRAHTVDTVGGRSPLHSPAWGWGEVSEVATNGHTAWGLLASAHVFADSSLAAQWAVRERIRSSLLQSCLSSSHRRTLNQPFDYVLLYTLMK